MSRPADEGVGGGRRRPPTARRVAVAAILLIGVAVAVTGAWRSLPGLGERGGGSEGGPNGFAVLDRPQTADDRSGSRELDGIFDITRDQEVDVDGIRVVDGGSDLVAELVPIRRKGRGATATDGQGFETLCLSYGAPFASVACGAAREVRREGLGGGSFSSSSDTGGPEPSHFYGVVPNRVARVEVTFSGGLEPISAEVEDNFYDAVSRDPGASDRVGKTRWFDEDGRELPR